MNVAKLVTTLRSHSGLNVKKISSFSKDTKSTHSPRTQKPKGDRLSAHSVFFLFSSFFFFSEKAVGAKPCECRQTPPVVVIFSGTMRRKVQYHGTSMGVSLTAVPMPRPSAPVMLCSTRVCSGACDKHACDSWTTCQLSGRDTRGPSLC